MSDCPRFGKWFGGCKFRPRHDEITTAAWEFSEREWLLMTADQMRACTPHRTYVRDVCVRCGKTVERKP